MPSSINAVLSATNARSCQGAIAPSVRAIRSATMGLAIAAASPPTQAPPGSPGTRARSGA
jgi:hypothetical protein